MMAGFDGSEKQFSRRAFLGSATLLGAGVGGLANGAKAADGPSSGPLRLAHEAGDHVSFFAGEQPLFEFRYNKSRPKTYVHPLFAPDGTAVTLDSPPDHVHHRGVMLAWSDVNGYDFWGEQNPVPHGQIVHQRFENIVERPTPSVTSVNHWIADGKVLVVERQTVAAPPPGANAVWLEWSSELAAYDGAVKLAANEHVYDGLGIRFRHSMDQGGVLNANGTNSIEAANGEKSSWCAYWGGSGDGGTYGVAIFDHPRNPRHPTPFFVMNQPFGYLSAAPTFREPFQLNQERKLRFTYAVVAFAGKPMAQKIDKLYQDWTRRKPG